MKSLTGTVISVKNAKTAVVVVESRWQHPLYKKTVKRTKKYMAHDEIGVKEGQKVSIIQSKPISSRKRWAISAATDKISK